MKVSSLNKGGGLFSGAAITGNKTITEKDLNSFFIVTAAATITLPKPQDIKAALGESLLLMSMTENAVSVALSAGATIDSYSGSMELLKGLPMDLIVTSGTTWAIRGVRAATDTEITAGLDKTRYLTPLEHAEHHLKDIPGYNHIINGNFDIWQRGTSQTIVGYGSDDRWYNGNVGSMKTHSRQSFSVGELFPDGTPCPAAYSRTVVSSIVGANNYTLKAQKIEDVRRLAGKKVVLSFYAKANTNKYMAIEVVQMFGDDGNPSSPVDGIGVKKINLTATWKRFVVNIELPSIYGKVLGTRGNSSTVIHLWFDAGTASNARTDSLGHQSGTFYIACVSLVEGDVDVKPIPRSYGEELALCQRYYATGGAYTRSHATGAYHVFNSPIYFPCTMRAAPVTTLTDGGGRLNVQSVLLASAPWLDSTRHEITSAGAGDCRALGDIWTADAEL